MVSEATQREILDLLNLADQYRDAGRTDKELATWRKCATILRLAGHEARALDFEKAIARKVEAEGEVAA